MGDIHSVDTLIGMTILSRVTGNRLGRVEDLLLDPVRGELLGLVAQAPDAHLYVMDYREVYSFGPDAVMARADDSFVPLDETLLRDAPGAKKNIAGAKIVTEAGKLLGQVANIYVHLSPPPLVLYEVRESLLDKLLGRGLFIPAALGRALSDDAERIIVPDDTGERAADSIETLSARLFSSPEDARVLIRNRTEDEETVVRGRDDDELTHTRREVSPTPSEEL